MLIDHVFETLKVGLDTLAAGIGSIQERLREAWRVIHTLKEDDFPLELRDEFRKLSDVLTTPVELSTHADPGVHTVGDAHVAREELDEEHARELALVMVQLFAHVSAEFWPNHKKQAS